jgi:hypothetical protein
MDGIPYLGFRQLQVEKRWSIPYNQEKIRLKKMLINFYKILWSYSIRNTYKSTQYKL